MVPNDVDDMTQEQMLARLKTLSEQYRRAGSQLRWMHSKWVWWPITILCMLGGANSIGLGLADLTHLGHPIMGVILLSLGMVNVWAIHTLCLKYVAPLE